jgi:folylpolyglutamate synthase/dihydropteroate synthase
VCGSKTQIETIRKIAKAPVEFIKGVEQNKNKKLAKKVLRFLFPHVSITLPEVKMPARWEKIEHKGIKIVLDGAHSPERFDYIVPKVQKLKDFTLVIGKTARHDDTNLDKIVKQASHVIWTTIPGKTCTPPEQLAEKYGVGVAEPNPKKAITASIAKGKTVLVTGSLYLCGFIKNVLAAEESSKIKEKVLTEEKHKS